MTRKALQILVTLIALAPYLALGGGPKCPGSSPKRDWKASPAVVEVKTNGARLFAVGDVHGDFVEFYELLLRAGVISGSQKPDIDSFKWNANDAILVQVGDLINKGEDSLDVIRFAMALEEKAKQAGGRAVFLAGNHEVGFFASPFDKKYLEFTMEIKKKTGDVCKSFVMTEKGQWLRNRPAAAMVNGVFLSHSGWTQQKDLATLSSEFQNAVDGNLWDSKFMCGGGSLQPQVLGFFNANVWWQTENSEKDLDETLKKVGAKQIMFGHDPNAFSSRGKVVGYFANAQARAVVKLDAGMWMGDSRGILYMCEKWNDEGACVDAKTFENPEKSDLALMPVKFTPLTLKEGLPKKKKTQKPDKKC